MVGKDGMIKPPRTKSYSKEKLYSIIKIKKKPPPPPKVGGDRRNNEPEYEEVGPPTALKKNQDKRGDGQHCDLCGSSEAAVRCDRCGSQAFCLSCDDMYHRHPRRSSHLRKAVDSLNSMGGGVRPPLPPKGEGQGAPPPQPPPRKNKRSGFLSNTGFNKKEQNYQYSTGSGHGSYRSASLTNLQNGPNNADGGSRYSLALPVRKPTSASSEAGGSAGRTIMGSLKRFMGARPLPPTPDQAKSALKNERPSSSAQKILTRANTSPSLPNLSEPLSNEDIRAGLPQSVLDINRTRLPNNSTSTPVTPASAHAQYPPLQPKIQPSNAHTQSLGRKFSLQQLPQTFDDKRTSMVEGTPGSVPWDAEAPKPAARTRSQSVSDDQWAQMMAAQVSGGNTDLSVLTCPPGHTPTDMSAFAGATTRRSFNTMGGGARSASSFGRGMVSSASVCDLNTLAQQQTQHGFNNSHGANSFQQLNMMGYNNGMMWGAPCDLCQGAGMYPGHPTASGMKRTASNLSMNLSSVGSDASGYPWGPPPPHMHHHMPPMYLGYYPGYHPHMGPPPMGSGMGLNMSIPDSMHTFGKVPSSPAPSLRSSSHRSHKSSKSRSFSAADTSGRSSRARKLKRSEESEESRSSSVSEDDDLDDRESKSGHHSSSIAWQCDHCTFINSGGARTCGMCSKTVGSSGRSSSKRGSERRRSERRRDRRTDHEDDERDVSDYDNDGVVKSNLSFNIKDSKRDTRTKVSGSSKSKSKKKSRRRGSSASDSESGSEGEEERLERHMKDLRLSSSSSRRRGSDYEGINHKDKDRERERSSRKKEGSSGRFKNWGKSHSERSRTPGRQTPRHASPVDDLESGELSPEPSPQDNAQGQVLNTNENEHNGSPDETIIEPDNSETTMKNEGKSRSGSRDRRYEIKKERAPTPPPSPVEENVQETNPENALIPQGVNGNKSRSCSPRLEVPKGRSPARSVRNSKGDADEPSFANTLDDITTIGTNEVADQDFSQYIDEHPQLEEPHDDVPVLEYIRPKTPEEDVVEEVKTIPDVPAPVPTVNGHVDTKENEIVSKDTGQTVQKPEVIPYSVYEPRYEPIEEPAQLEIPAAGGSNQAGIQTQAQGQGTQEEAEENNEMGTLERFLKAHEGKQGSPLILRTIDVARASSGSSLGHSSPPDRDRQYTPLSCSSSDAQFYSPPDSPDLSLSEQLKDVPAISQTQALTLNQDGRPTNISQTLRSREDESYLVTALESILTTAKAAEDVKSSRETIRSSMEQLPYSEEAFEGESTKELPPRPASVGAAPPLDNYESLSFQDALSSSGAAKLARSSSAKDLLLSSAVVYDSTTKEMSSGILSLQQEADRQARAAAWSKEDLSEKYMTVEEIITKRRQKVMETQGLQLVQVLRDAEEAGYSSEEVSIALTHCGDKSPLEWLKENWKHMVDTVLTLATNYGHERRVNDIGSISAHEACIALRIHKGNIWAAVTECVEQRQKKFNEIYSRGKFKRADVVKALEMHDGDVDAAFLEVNKSQLQPFLMKIWGSGSSSPSQAKGTQPPAPAVSSSVSNEVSSSPSPSRSTTQEVVTTQSTQTDKDVVVHPLKAFTHYADLSVSEYFEGRLTPSTPGEETTPYKPSSFISSNYDTSSADSRANSDPKPLLALNGKSTPSPKAASKKARKYSSTLHVSLSTQNQISEHTTEKGQASIAHQKPFQDLYTPDGYESIATPLEEKERLAGNQPESKSAPASARNSLLLEDYEVSDEEESVSITTGRLSLSLSAASINVKSEVIQTAQVPAAEHEELNAANEEQTGDVDQDATTDENVKRDESKDIAESNLEADADSSAKGKSEDTEGDEGKQSPERHLLEEPGMAQTRTGPVTVQKASAIVGKAIAKAMARETSARESLSRSVTPEGQENTLTTPEPSEGEEDTTGQVTVSDSDDEDHLRTLDTIPEEEEMSERTESRVSRSASRNLFLPFNPTDVIQLSSPVAKALGNLTGTKKVTAKAKSKESQSSTTDSVPGTPHGYYNAAQQNTYYNESGVKNYYNEATGKNYYNEAGAKIEGVISDKHPPDDYESMAEVKEESDAGAQEREMTADASVATTRDAKEGDDDDDDEEEVIYYEEVILKTDEKLSDENKSGTSGTRRRRRRRRKSRSHGGATAGTSSRADVVESPSGDDLAPAASAATPSPTPAAVPEPSKERSPSADYSTVSKTSGKTSRLSDNKSYSIIEMVKTTEGTSKSVVTSSSGESEEEGPEKAEMVSQDDRLKVPNLLVQIEGLKARHSKEPDYQEVRELKEQIQMMRKQLEAKMEEDTEARPDTPETPQDEEPPKGPLLVLQGSPTNERPPSREYEQLKFDRTVRRLLAEGQAGSYEKAELAAQLMNFNFDEYDSIQAAEECSSIYTAIQFLQQECELCAEKYPMGKMVSMLQCTHRCCRECAKTYFTFQIKTKNIRDLRCPFCNEPDLDACEEIANEYLNNMDILLKNIIDEETHELFQRKLRDWTLMKDPNFRWCNKCSSGFIANPRARKLICPDCKDVTCAHCRATWEPAHEGISCEAFAQWKVDNDLEVQAQGVAKHLAENGITCPKCKFTYSLAKGGCMHFTCTQCKYEFCSGCGQPFRQGSKCPVGPYCERLGLHAHHPRNCLFYLRDKEPHQLQNLLKDAGISYDTEAPQVRDSHGQRVPCLVQEQKELPDGLKDDICGRIVPDGYAGLCKTHYIEYLARLVFKFNLDPLPLMDEEDLRFILRRDNLQPPKRRKEDTQQGFLERINELIKEHLPLDSNEQ
ncbi:E3 ubiquitin-protein ligase lubel-like isoform X11 [Macrobrachium nipponense]|uniref:E3 ubiquitin-protein ligase lubel-like isoform X11 n=1 Tax=Macrobrachium nipponense TaxID=159736 RepID=UPI0030C89004